MRNYVQEGEMLGLEGMAFLHYIQEQERIRREQLALYYQKREEQRQLWEEQRRRNREEERRRKAEQALWRNVKLPGVERWPEERLTTESHKDTIRLPKEPSQRVTCRQDGRKRGRLPGNGRRKWQARSRKPRPTAKYTPE
ncbi:vicilin-like seed storage protein At2g18540 [Penaeus chinensis]|uniref:vicilin-like seed storage protein At2g18540 n=1 Tax=Penaeus chinensis TaxID=139456 RepID=UPI001FB6C891|nr:vicilin-like seed storage protein At2g18540 [Penaeus chinensis]